MWGLRAYDTGPIAIKVHHPSRRTGEELKLLETIARTSTPHDERFLYVLDEELSSVKIVEDHVPTQERPPKKEADFQQGVVDVAKGSPDLTDPFERRQLVPAWGMSQLSEARVLPVTLHQFPITDPLHRFSAETFDSITGEMRR